MHIRQIILSAVIFPTESCKYTVNKNDLLYLEPSHKLAVAHHRLNFDLTCNEHSLVQCGKGSVVLRNDNSFIATYKLIHLSIKFDIKNYCVLKNFDKRPFGRIIDSMTLNNSCAQLINSIVDSYATVIQENNLTNRKIDPRLIKVNRIIRTQYHLPLTLQSLAEYTKVHPTYLSNTYSKVFGISPIYFLNQTRIKKAKELLIDTNFTVNDIARKIGYTSLPQFSSIFKRFTSITPREFRNRH